MNYFNLLPNEIISKELNKYLTYLDISRLRRTYSKFNSLLFIKNVSKQEKNRKRRILALRKFNPSLYLMEKYPEKRKKDWNWETFSQNINFTIDIYKKYPNEKWSWYRISKHTNITLEIIQENKDLPWNWEGITCNPNITMDIIKNNPDLPWVYGSLASNPNLTEEMLKKHMAKNFTGRNVISIYDSDLIPCNSFTTAEIVEKYIDEVFWPNVSQSNLGTK